MPSFEAIVESHVKRWVTRRRLREKAREEREQGAESVAVPPPVTVSYAYGSGGDAVCETVSRTLNHQLFDREIIEAISRNTKVQSQLIELLDEGKRKLIDSLAEQLFSRRVIDDMSYLHALTRVVRSIAILDPALFVGRGACHILKDAAAFHARITAPFDVRVGRIMETEGLPRVKAKEKTASQDEARRRFIKKNFNRDIDDPTAYDVTINTARIPPSLAAKQILLLYRRLL